MSGHLFFWRMAGILSAVDGKRRSGNGMLRMEGEVKDRRLTASGHHQVSAMALSHRGYHELLIYPLYTPYMLRILYILYKSI